MFRGFEAKNQPVPWHGGTGLNGALGYFSNNFFLEQEFAKSSVVNLVSDT